MAKFTDFDRKIVLVVRINAGMQGDHLLNRHPHELERLYLTGVVGHHAQRIHTEMLKHGTALVIFATIGSKPQLFVGFDRIGPAVLQAISFDFVEYANAPTFLAQIKNRALPLLGNLLHSCLQLRAAITAQAEQAITGQTFRVQSTQYWLARTEFDHGQRYVLLARRRVLETVNGELPPLRRQRC